MNNIVIFFISFEKHINYFTQMFQIFDKMNIHLTFIKTFLKYSSIQLLKQYVNILKFITVENKLIIIRNLEFPRNLIILNRYFNLINYFKQYVFYYIVIISLLLNFYKNEKFFYIAIAKTLREILANSKSINHYCECLHLKNSMRIIIYNKFSLHLFYFIIIILLNRCISILMPTRNSTSKYIFIISKQTC